MAEKYTLNELLIIAAAREIRNGDKVILGVGLPTVSGAVAKALHAPDAVLMMESGIIDFEPLVPPNHIADVHSCRGFSYATDLFSMFTLTYRGFVDVCFLGVGQIDRFGNINTTVIGDYLDPDVRLPGSGGAPEFLSYAGKTVLTMRGGEFVEKLDYLTSPGYLKGGRDRENCGYFPKDSGPSMLLTAKGVFRFDKETREIYLSRVHPGVKVEEITVQIPWKLKVSNNLEETAPPTKKEIEFIRNFAPTESVGRKMMYELGTSNLLKKLSERNS